MDLLNNSLHSTGGKINIVGDENTNEEAENIDCNSSECLPELAQTAFIDPNIQYQLQQETIKDGQITYRVIPITSNIDKLNENGPIISDVNFSLPHNPNATILQTSLQSLHPSSYIAMPGIENIRTHPRVALFSSDISENVLINGNSQGNSLFSSNYRDKSHIQGNGGHLVLMMSPELLQGHKLSSQSSPLSGNESRGGSGGAGGGKDEKRRFIHNEVERRRRDKINTWITKLSKIVPDCNSDQSKQGQSKGGILAKTADYIHELKQMNENLFRGLKEAERVTHEVDRLRATNLDLASKLALFQSELSDTVLRQRYKELKQENSILMAFIKQHFPNVEIQITHTIKEAEPSAQPTQPQLEPSPSQRRPRAAKGQIDPGALVGSGPVDPGATGGSPSNAAEAEEEEADMGTTDDNAAYATGLDQGNEFVGDMTLEGMEQDAGDATPATSDNTRTILKGSNESTPVSCTQVTQAAPVSCTMVPSPLNRDQKFDLSIVKRDEYSA